ncbi:hypothetical protein [Streptomyces sp. uw30]|uniref:hypothetical protein n=1 Tax=Streptomyces sp. uw30 TaxID=1828179 RepID=UPI0021C61C52|nr:hypothetical protein [Streptomyces sp. uw30]
MFPKETENLLGRPGTACTNPYPDTAEKAEVEGNFGGELVGRAPAADPELIVD